MGHLSYKEIMEQLKKTYDEIAEDFSRTRSRPWEEMAELAKEVWERARVLDIGCGNGRLLKVLPPNIEYLGVDLSERLIKEAQSAFPEKRFLVGDFLSLSKKVLGKDYDFVFMIAVLHHLPTPSARLRFLRKARDLLKQNGKLMLTVWNLWKEEKHKSAIDEKGDIFVPFGQKRIPRYYHAFTPKELTDLVNKAGFEVEKFQENRNLLLVGRKT